MRPLALIAFAAILAGRDVSAQAPRRVPARCDPVTTTSFEFGRTGGNIRTAAVRIGADGAVSRRTGKAWVAGGPALSRDAVIGLARLAWSNGFTRLPTAPTRPTRIPDAARDYIDLHSACGSKHVESVADESAPPFRELLGRLTLAAP